MTTIVYHRNEIAYDSRTTRGSVIHDNNVNKRISDRGVQFFIAGTCGMERAFVDAYRRGQWNNDTDIAYDNQAIVYDKGKLLLAFFDGEQIHIEEQRRENYFAIGSGADFAIGAIDQGCKTAALAVEVAMRHDCCTGGRIRTFILKG